MPDRESKKRWDKANTVMVNIKFQRKTDQDIIDFLQSHETDTRSKQIMIKQGLRLLMAQEGEEETTCSE